MSRRRQDRMLRVRIFLETHFIVLFFGVALGLYHLHNTFRLSFYGSAEKWTLSQIELGFRSRAISIPVPERKAENLPVGISAQTVFQPRQLDVVRFVPVDASAGKLAHLGYAARYLGKQIRNDILMGTTLPRQNFFWRDEIWLQYPSAAKALKERLGDPIRELVKELTDKGVTVAVLPIPTQLSVQRQGLPGPLPGSSPWLPPKTDEPEDPLAAYEGMVDADPDHNVNILAPYLTYQKRFPDRDLYGNSESHWSSLGISLAAKEVFQKLNPGTVISDPQLRFRSPARTDYDFMNHLILPTYLTESMWVFNWEEPMYDLELPEGFTPTAGRLVIAGTSCAARHHDTPFSFGAVLSRALGRELVDYSKERFWLWGSFEKMREESFKFRPGDILVWEVPIKSPPLKGHHVVLPDVEPIEAPINQAS